MEIGYFLSSEEYGPKDLVEQAVRAEAAGWTELLISDHYHPWVDAQGHSPFAWGVIGAIAAATTDVTLTTGVTCPTVRIHPAVLAQATATASLLLDGRFRFGVGSGENLNEHILGDGWPDTDTRLAMLEEAVDVVRRLWTGDQVSHEGKHYTVRNARLYDPPTEPPPVIVSGFGPKAATLAGRIGDGFICVQPNAELRETFVKAGGADKPTFNGMKVCYGTDEDAAVRLAYETWPNEGVPGELAQELPTPAHFEQACELVTPEKVAESVVCGNDPDRFVEAITRFSDAGYDHLYIQQIGPDQAGFLEFFEREVRPRL
jgi:G6PDH family F420-dependent oxidoreductase